MRFALPLLAMLALAGCASPAATEEGDAPVAPTPEEGAPAPVELTFATSGAYPVNPGFSPASATVAAGAPLRVTFTNAEIAPVVPHDWVLEGYEGTDVIGPGASASVDIPALAAGEYVYFCSVGDHRARGMEGTLIVE